MSRLWTPLPHFRGARAYFKGNWRNSVGLFCVLLLAACGESTPSGYAGGSTSSTQSETLQPLIAPPHAADGPAAAGTTGAKKGADGLPLLQPIKGVNTALFAEKIGEDARLNRLENAVQELRNDFDAMSPAIVRLVAIEGDIQNLIKQLEVLTGGNSGSEIPAEITPIEESALDAPMPSKDAPLPSHTEVASLPEEPASDTGAPPEPLPPVPLLSPPAQEEKTETMASGPPAAPEAPPPPAANGPPAITAADGPAVQAIRIGEHPGKVRIVLDIRGKTSFTADLDNEEKILVVEMPDAAWNAETQKNFTDNPVIASYRTENRPDKGTMLILQLKKTTSIGYKGVMDNDTGQGQRIVIDLMAP